MESYHMLFGKTQLPSTSNSYDSLNWSSPHHDQAGHGNSTPTKSYFGRGADAGSQGQEEPSSTAPVGKKGEKKERRPRYAFQTRSHVNVLDDGYRWRKYGQKAVKNNKFPRSYYRCTRQGCSVKKQVQRVAMDEGVVVTTYEGTHSHPVENMNENFEHILNQMQIYSFGQL